jgi:hypothetical protein
VTPGERLRAARIAAGHKSASSAAAAAGMTESAYRSHENGANGISADQALHYGRMFGVSPAQIMFGEEGRAAPTVVALVRMLERKGLLSGDEARRVFEEAALIADQT